MTATVHKLPSRRVNRTVTLTRTPNADMRPSGENLSDEQVRRLIKAAAQQSLRQTRRAHDRASMASWPTGV